jgi:subtilisin family serine protease
MIGGKFLNSGGSGSIADAIDTVEFMIQTKAFFGGGANIRILNNSWGGGGFSGMMAAKITDAENANMLFVAAAGNNNSNNDIFPFYPASYANPNVLAVLATTDIDNRAGFSNYGATTVDLGAPGQSIQSTLPGNSYGSLSGTSMASPHVAGAAALVLSECNLNTADLKANLMDNVDVLGALAGLVVTNGRLNVNKAILACGGGPPPGADLVVSALTNPPGSAARGTKFSVTETTKNQGTGSTSIQEADATDNDEADAADDEEADPAAVNQTKTRYYLSLDALKDAGDKRMKGAHGVPVLAAGAEHTKTRKITIPGNTVPNTYFLLACADDTKKVVETNEGNNCKASATTIVVTP